jgi:hypothetical protein
MDIWFNNGNVIAWEDPLVFGKEDLKGRGREHNIRHGGIPGFSRMRDIAVAVAVAGCGVGQEERGRGGGGGGGGQA